MPPTSARLTAPPCDDADRLSSHRCSPPSPTRPPTPPRPHPLPWRPPILSQFFFLTPSRAELPLPTKIRCVPSPSDSSQPEPPRHPLHLPHHSPDLFRPFTGWNRPRTAQPPLEFRPELRPHVGVLLRPSSARNDRKNRSMVRS
ncbi:hypothetical protein GQ55_3G367200 [Panicum hallii var. hallii]|uniref:Uncharacterized protein n=1 Tax=Panicum hallii var. hallii TaxID=1504633 RepID=A0A2T7EG58_9POAL|nr:hypothetical protein GQ55_3G367200 [Panicum hallii var. hallii]